MSHSAPNENAFASILRRLSEGPRTRSWLFSITK